MLLIKLYKKENKKGKDLLIIKDNIQKLLNKKGEQKQKSNTGKVTMKIQKFLKIENYNK